MLSIIGIVELVVKDSIHLLFEDWGIVVGIGTVFIFWECQLFDAFLYLLAGVCPNFERGSAHCCRRLFPRS